MRYTVVEIDMRNDFADDPRAVLPVLGTYGLVAKIATLEERAGTIIVAADTHSEDDPVSKEEFESFPPHCVTDTWGWRRIIGLNRMNGCDLLVKKNSYDMWKGMIGIDPDGAAEKKIVAKLDNADTILVTGVVTGICVKAFVDGAIERGYARKLVVVSDCVANLENVSGVPTTRTLFQDWAEKGVRIMTFSDVVKEVL